MKKLKYLYYCFIGLIIYETGRSAYTISPHRKNKEEIFLDGILNFSIGNGKFAPVQILKNTLFISVDFYTNTSNIIIEILDRRRNIVYHRRINAIIGEQLLINTSYFDEGKYVIYITYKHLSSKGIFEIRHDLSQELADKKSFKNYFLTRKIEAI